MTTTLRIIVAGIFLSCGLGLLPGAGSALAADEAAPPADTVREEVGKPLKEATELTKAKQHKEALAKIDEADAVPAKTPYESYVISRNRGAAAFAAGNADLAAKSFSEAIAFIRGIVKKSKHEPLNLYRRSLTPQSCHCGNIPVFIH
jgi:hypothetical protein